MIRKEFITKIEADIYLAEQKIRMDNGYLTKSEREELKQLLEKPEVLIKKEQILKGKPIVTDIRELKKPCNIVENNEDIKQIIQDLKDTFERGGMYGISANQIGYNKRISYIKMPKKIDPKTKEIEFTELILINAKIIEKDRKLLVKNEECISFPNLSVDTDRYVFVTVTYLNEKFEEQTGLFSDLESVVLQHEIAHNNGQTIFDFKHKGR